MTSLGCVLIISHNSVVIRSVCWYSSWELCPAIILFLYHCRFLHICPFCIIINLTTCSLQYGYSSDVQFSPYDISSTIFWISWNCDICLQKDKQCCHITSSVLFIVPVVFLETTSKSHETSLLRQSCTNGLLHVAETWYEKMQHIWRQNFVELN